MRPRFIASTLLKREAWERVGGFPEDLRSADQRALIAFRANDAAALDALYAENAVLVNPGAEPLDGRAAIDALAPLPARILVTVGRDRDPGAAETRDELGRLLDRLGPVVVGPDGSRPTAAAGADDGGAAVDLFRDNYLEVGQGGASPVDYPYAYTAPVNTGVPSGFDLNNNGVVDTTPGDQAYGDDSYGFGLFPGQYGMVVYSKYPIDYRAIRTFQLFKWKDMPGALLPDNPATAAPNHSNRVTFDEQAGKKTKVTLRHAGIPSGADRDGAQQGWLETVDRLAGYLAEA
mgnify:CR=1 FL=1